MKKRNAVLLIAAALLLVTFLTGCGTIRAMFNGAHDEYVQGENAWNNDRDGSYALVKMAKTMEIDPEYEAPKDFLIKNYKAMAAEIEGQLSSLSRDNFNDLLRRIDIYENLIDFHFYVQNGVVVNPVVLGDRVMMLETKDYSDERTGAIAEIIDEGMIEGLDFVKSGDFEAAEKIFTTLTARFLEGDQETEKRRNAAEAYADKALSLAKSSDMKDIDKGYDAVKKGRRHNGSLASLDDAETSLNNQKGEILLSDARALIAKKDAASLIKAYKIYQQVINMFPENADYKRQADDLTTDIAEAQYNLASKKQRNFNGKRDVYDEIIALYEAADSWSPDYNGLRAKMKAFERTAVIEIFIGVRHSDDNEGLQRALLEAVEAKLPENSMFEIIDLNSPEGRELSSEVSMGSIPMGLAERYGFEYIVIADNFRIGAPQLQSSRYPEYITNSYWLRDGSIGEMSSSDHDSWQFSANLVGEYGKHINVDNVDSALASTMRDKDIEDIWFDVSSTETTEETWYEARVDFSISFYDATSRRNWSQTQKRYIESSRAEGRTDFSTDAGDYMLRTYLFNRYSIETLDLPSMKNWDSKIISSIKDEFKNGETAGTVVANLR